MTGKMGRALRWAALVGPACVAALIATDASAYMSQADGTVVPQTNRLQQCLDRAATAEATPDAVDAVADAAVLPEAYRPVENPVGSGSYPVTFAAIGEGGGYRNSFGWHWTDEDPSVVTNLHSVFDCRTGGTCNCPCNPDTSRPGGAWLTTIDFATQPGFSPGRAIGFWLRTPERIDGSGGDPDNCGDRTDTQNRIYFTSKALNDDGDYLHFLVYKSATRTDTYYFGFEDLFRGGDNDFEDMLVRGSGLVPLCDPQPETCNGLDDDCDGVIDDGVTEPCSTACGSGVRTCVAGSFGACSAPTPTAETCNGIDDNCNGTVDEGLTRPCSSACGSGMEVCVDGSWADCTAPTPTIETCNGVDDDCDGTVDEGISRACFSACGSGTETCMDGSYIGCTAPMPAAETCNGADDDCDGLTDEGLTRGCTNACGSGIETCISGSYVGCTAPTPGLEACNGIDDDCDGTVDEGLTRTCSTACGTGTETCVDGSYVGCDAPTPSPETCNDVDDDCNGVIDDGNPGGGAPCLPDGDGGYTLSDGGTGGGDGGTGGRCIAGRVRCQAGSLVCLGASSPTPETCNCRDDDCDGLVDEDSSSLCPGGGACIDCTCQSPCAHSEFACPPGEECDTSRANPDAGILGYCVPGPCAGVTCSDTEVCDPSTGMCRDLCAGRTCPDGMACLRGACVEDDCYGRGCPTGQRCRGGACEDDPCAGVACGPGQYCRDGTCTAACTTPCATGEVCQDGACVPSGCPVCTEGQTCVDGACVDDHCSPACGHGRVCRGDQCVDDPCSGIHCPDGTTCADGVCGARGTPPPPPPSPKYGLAAGGGGCVCTAAGSEGGGTSPGVVLWLSLLGLGLVWRRRVRRRGRGPRTGRDRARTGEASAPGGVRPGTLHRLAVILAAFAVAPFASGCQVDPFCFSNCGGQADARPPDAGPPDARPADGCVATGPEVCNGIDDDCNGLVDDGFDLSSDPHNCGACGNECNLPNAFPTCTDGACAINRCEIGFEDLDGVPGNGCEYTCLPSGSELCDGIDDDCDGSTDEGFDLSTDLANCGACGNVCTFSNASASCAGGACVMGTCNPGFVDLDGDSSDGCEYACTPTGAEVCNGVNDNCDGRVDEGFDLSTDPHNCGVCGHTCTFPHATGACVAGVCAVASCDSGYVDIDGNPATGCEYACTPTGGVDACNGADDDCDGAFDEAESHGGHGLRPDGRCVHGGPARLPARRARVRGGPRSDGRDVQRRRRRLRRHRGRVDHGRAHSGGRRSVRRDERGRMPLRHGRVQRCHAHVRRRVRGPDDRDVQRHRRRLRRDGGRLADPALEHAGLLPRDARCVRRPHADVQRRGGLGLQPAADVPTGRDNLRRPRQRLRRYGRRGLPRAAAVERRARRPR